MDFALTAEQRAVYDGMATFAASISGDAVANDRDGVFDRTAWQRCADEGVLSLALPARYNTTGRDTDLLTAAVAMEALGYGGGAREVREYPAPHATFDGPSPAASTGEMNKLQQAPQAPNRWMPT